MKSILAFGDSLTWGFEAGTFQRHAFEDRWPNVLAAGLGAGVRVIAEGLNGRTTVFPDPTATPERNGAVALPMLLETHQPLDLLIIMLGTNDIKYANRCRAFDAAMGMERLIKLAKSHQYIEHFAPPKILVISPPPLCKTNDAWFNDLWGHALEESKLFAQHYARIAQEQGVHFFDAGGVCQTDPTDGGHLSAAETRKLGAALIPIVEVILRS